MAEQSLKDKTVKGTIWSGIDNVVQFGVTFVVSIILARLLSPDDYGLIGIISIFTVVCGSLISGGMGTALIRKKEATEDDYNTAFIVNMGMSILLYAVLFLCAPFIASFFGREELLSLTRVSTISLIIGALAMVQRVRLVKRIDFKTQTKITFFASLLSGAVGICMALAGFGVWALVFQSLTSQILTTILLWFFNKWMPSLSFSANSFHDLFGFGWKMMVSGLINSIWKELYQVVVGKFYSPATLGQYTRAKSFSSLFSVNLSNVIERVTYPVLAEVQDDKERMVSAYRRIIKMTMFATAIGMFFIGAISEPLLYCLIGPKWHEAATYLPLICISGSLYPLHAINLNMLQVQGRSDLFLGLEIIKKAIGIGPLLVGAFIGIMPMLYVNLLVGAFCFFLNSHYSGRLLGYSSWMQIKDVAPSYLMATLTGLTVYFLKYLPVSNFVILPLQILTGFVVVWLVNEKCNLEEYNELKNIVCGVMVKFKRN